MNWAKEAAERSELRAQARAAARKALRKQARQEGRIIEPEEARASIKDTVKKWLRKQ
jgi:hypothetical protein